LSRLLGRVPALIAGAVALSVAFAIALGINVMQLRDSFAWVEHTNEVLREINAVARNLLEAESGERGYLLTGDASYRASYEESSAAIPATLGTLGALIADNPEQAGRLDALRPVIAARLDELARAVAFGPARLNDALQVLGSARATRLTPRIQDELGQMRRIELALLTVRQQRVDRDSLLLAGLAAATSVLAVLFSALGALLFQRHRDERALREVQGELLQVSRLSTMGEMAAALAHELNQPLTAMSNYLQAGRRLAEQMTDARAPTLREVMTKAAEQAMRAGRTIQRLREFVARGDSERRIESLRKVVEEAGALALVVAKERTTAITVELDPRVDDVLIDKVQIQQVLLNLLRNAIEAMQDSARRTIVVTSEPAADGMVRVSLADSGPGMAPEVMAKLFQPFVTTKSQGMGIGLSISRTIVAAHGGEITAEANPAGGTIFRFTVPAAEPEALQDTA